MSRSLADLYRVYQNLRRVMVTHREYDALPQKRTAGVENEATNFDHHAEEIPMDKFMTAMKFHQYVRMAFALPDTGLPVYVYLFNDPQHVGITEKFKRILQEYRKDPCMLYTVADIVVSNYIQNNVMHLPEYRAIGVMSYVISMFLLPIERAPLAPVRSEILSNEDAKQVLGDLYCAPQQLPSMALSDPICIKHGARVNQIIRIVMYSETTGLRMEYRRVTALDATNVYSNLI